MSFVFCLLFIYCSIISLKKDIKLLSPLLTLLTLKSRSRLCCFLTMKHSSQEQFLYKQFPEWPLVLNMSPWFLHSLHSGEFLLVDISVLTIGAILLDYTNITAANLWLSNPHIQTDQWQHRRIAESTKYPMWENGLFGLFYNWKTD